MRRTAPFLALYRALLVFLPPAFRREYGADMAQLLADRLARAPSGWSRLRILGRALLDLLRHLPAEWIRALTSHGPKRTTVTTMTTMTTMTTKRPPSGGSGALRSDFRQALRALRSTPGATLVCLAALALGIGAVTAVFTVVNGILLRPLPYEEPERLVSVWPEVGFNSGMVARVDEGVPALDAVAGVAFWEFSIVGDGEPERLDGAVVGPELFPILGAGALEGRTLLPGDAEPGAEPVVVLGHGLWTRRFGADPGVIGRALQLPGYGEARSRTVVGVLPPSFRTPGGGNAEVWVPMERRPPETLATDDSWHVSHRVARLAPGASAELAREQLRRVAADIQAEIPSMIDEADVRGADVRPLLEQEVGPVGAPLWLLLGSVGLVLLVACANVANVLLARGEARGRETAVRRALGAGRWPVVRLHLLESGLLGLVGGGLGVAAAFWSVPAVLAFAPDDLPRAAEISVDGRVLAVALAACALTALLSGTLPALRGSRRDPAEALRGGGRGVTGRTGTAPLVLVGLQVAAAVVLVTGSGLMTRSFLRLTAVDPGFDAAEVLAFRLTPPSGVYESGARNWALYDRVIRTVEALPGVRSAGAIHLLPTTSGDWSFPAYPEGHPVAEGEPAPSVPFRIVTPGYFESMGIPLRAGRLLEPADGPDAEPVLVVNEAFSRRYYPDGEAVGRVVRFFSPGGEPRRIAGVVGNVHQQALDRAPVPEMYVPAGQYGWAVSTWITVRTAGDPAAAAPGVRAAVQREAPDVPISGMEPLERIVGRSAATERFVTLLLTGFGLVALVLGGLGVYGVAAYTAARRLPEIGVKLALGASRARVLRSFLIEGMHPVAAGLAGGVVLALLAGRVLEGLLFQVSARDPLVLSGVVAVLAAVGVLAALVPSLRAVRLDPSTVLREE